MYKIYFYKFQETNITRRSLMSLRNLNYLEQLNLPKVFRINHAKTLEKFCRDMPNLKRVGVMSLTVFSENYLQEKCPDIFSSYPPRFQVATSGYYGTFDVINKPGSFWQ